MTLYRQIAGAVFAGLVAFGGALGAALTGSESIGNLAAGQWLSAALAAVVAAGGVLGFTQTSTSSPAKP